MTSSFIHLTATRWDHGQMIRCEASNEVLEQLELSPQEADMVLNVQFAPVLSPLTLDPVTGNSSDEVRSSQITASVWSTNINLYSSVL